MPRMTYETIQKQIQKLQAQAKKLEANHLTKKVQINCSSKNSDEKTWDLARGSESCDHD